MATTSSSVRSDSGQISTHLCEYGLTIRPKNNISRQKRPPKYSSAFLHDLFPGLQFSIVMFYDVTGEPQGQWSVHLSDQRLQTNRAQSQPHCQRSVASRRKVAKCESGDMFVPQSQYYHKRSQLGTPGPGSSGQTHIHNDTRVPTSSLKCVSIPISPQPRPDSFQVVLISSQSKYSFLIRYQDNAPS